MSMIVTSRGYTWQPGHPAEVALENPLTRGTATGLLPTSGGVYETARRAVRRPAVAGMGGSLGIRPGPNGLGAAQVAATSDWWDLEPSGADPTTGPYCAPTDSFTILVLVDRFGNAVGNAPIFGHLSPSTNPYYCWGLTDAGGTGGIQFSFNSAGTYYEHVTSSIGVGRHLIVATRNITTGYASVWVDGARAVHVATGVGSINYFSSGGTRGVALGNFYNYLGATRSFNGAMNLAWLWTRALSDQEIVEVSRNPWQLFAPVRRPLFFASSGTTSATLTSQGQAATSLKAGRNISVTFSSAGQAATTLLKGAIIGKTFSAAGQAVTSLLGSYSVAGGNLLTINGQAATSFKAGRIVGKTLTSQGQASTSFLKGAVVSATLTSQGQAATTILGGLGSASATFAILGRASTNFLVPSSTRGGGAAKKKNLRKKVKKRIEEDLFFIESSFKEAKKDKPVKERLQDIVQLQESLQPIIDRLKTLLPDDKIIQVEAKEELTEFKHIMKRFDSLEQRLQDIEDLTTIILSEI